MYLEQIQHVVQHIDWNGEDRFFIPQSQNNYTYVKERESGTNGLFEALSNAIYSEFYSTGGSPAKAKSKEVTAEGGAKKPFLHELSLRNKTTEGFDEGWRIETHEINGMYYAVKGNFKRQMAPGDFISEFPGAGIPEEGHTVWYYRRKDLAQEADYFYYMNSQTVGDTVSSFNIRIYFNICAEGCPALVESLSSLFNQNRIPFDFKCLSDPERYDARADTAVLYLAKPYVNIGLYFLPEIIHGLSRFLKDPVPMFTLPLTKGVSFAESPPGPQDSFGSSRAKVISQGIVYAIDKKLPRSGWLQEVVTFIRQTGFDLDRFYLNPNAGYYYQIPNIH